MLCYSLQKHVQAADALTHGLKRRRRYRWYGVWDVWRRILFVAANLLISVTTRNIVLVLYVCKPFIITLSNVITPLLSGVFCISCVLGHTCTSIIIIKNEVGCRDDNRVKNCRYKKVYTVRRSESIQQSSATQSLHLSFGGLQKIVECSHSSSQCLISTVFGTVSPLHPTSLICYTYS